MLQEMLLDLCQHVQSCLHAHNKAPKSFYDEMLLNQRREQKRAAEEQQRHNELQSRREQKQVPLSRCSHDRDTNLSPMASLC